MQLCGMHAQMQSYVNQKQWQQGYGFLPADSAGYVTPTRHDCPRTGKQSGRNEVMETILRNAAKQEL